MSEEPDRASLDEKARRVPMTIWEILFPWPALKQARETIALLDGKLVAAMKRIIESAQGKELTQARRRRTIAETSLDKAHREIVGLRAQKNVGLAEIEALEREKQALSTELLQTKRAGFASIAEDLGVSEEDLMEGKIEALLHDDPRAVLLSLDNAKASEIKFRLVKTVNRELRLVIRNLIDGLYLTDLTEESRMFLRGAEPYATPLVMGDKRKVLGFKEANLQLNPPKGGDNEAQAQAGTDEEPAGEEGPGEAAH